MDLALLSAIFVAFSLTAYILLDGFDLGVGLLLLTEAEETLRDRMVESIVPTWDGNETWLIMAGVALLALFPVAYGILLPAFYVPLIIMLLSLGLRGVSFEFRFQIDRGRRAWDIAFAVGSVGAASMQGMIVGGLLQGINVQGESFRGSVFDVVRPFSLLTAITLLTGYVVLGAGWLRLKSTGPLRCLADRRLRWSAPLFMVLAVATCYVAYQVQPGIRAAWATHPVLLGTLCLLFVCASGALNWSIGRRSDGRPFVWGLALFALGVAGIGVTIFPDIVPFRLTLWAAASSRLSQLFVLTGAAIVAPVVLAYSAFAYRVFGGKTPERGWEA